MLSKYEKGTKTPTAEALETLAESLDAEMGYFHGLGDHYDDIEEGFARAAIDMSFVAFARDLKFSTTKKEWCRRALPHPAAPRTAAGWRALAEMMELALGPDTGGSMRAVS